MHQYGFTLIFAESLESAPDLADALFARLRRWDAGNSNELFFIDFHREATTLEDAICSAVEDVGTAGYEVARVKWG